MDPSKRTASEIMLIIADLDGRGLQMMNAKGRRHKLMSLVYCFTMGTYVLTMKSTKAYTRPRPSILNSSNQVLRFNLGVGKMLNGVWSSFMWRFNTQTGKNARFRPSKGAPKPSDLSYCPCMMSQEQRRKVHSS